MFLGFQLQDMLGASIDTSPSTLEWALYEFSLHLEIIRKV
jgi:cytochrome P450